MTKKEKEKAAIQGSITFCRNTVREYISLHSNMAMHLANNKMLTRIFLLCY